MKTWTELEFVLHGEEIGDVPQKDVLPRPQPSECTGWEDVVFEIADDPALD